MTIIKKSKMKILAFFALFILVHAIHVSPTNNLLGKKHKPETELITPASSQISSISIGNNQKINLQSEKDENGKSNLSENKKDKKEAGKPKD